MFVGMFFGGWGKSESLGGLSQLEFQNRLSWLIWCRGFALKGEVLFFAPPKKSTQKKRGPTACPLRGFPALLGILSARRTRRICCACGWQIQLDTAARWLSKYLRCSAAPTVLGF
jgi:hypothetical protein